ncbi:pyruvate dehydrogenase complex dihydrolipoamide acetyltransferase [Leptospira bandrabouensis]|uniref:Acetyltransferase component of pyruvate dehydrogenase complex n=1 Tax=Leptospira bandrabouensis TaxID=2484903 RepID=A0A6H3NLE3_9LEPT|nr:pyruvate dehydrogenase complex dihydrolipoamide acetyltransferase [Leptospira bandrabouensis]MCG6145428.1 pyruvate dehydrogenase complex dihydrolipoamide acetyltransferase [Leptospira bandrabouensis]MCG6152459.1 pyruvate dehydrogenase complex dihydrolipoamide acetyltransferase [Leptospira bandrabouensis]MCG6161052.1 pyruvate dehydrogenase complex dihydrolipoamide acetyltransferase [Leptospira bandrabouensis]MCG6164824.1 pyruvate dehydrogenase complex dihydrolipoamide acetyltransferase [Lepto
MAKIQEMTQLSPTMEEGTIVKWLKKEGDSVSPGDIIAEVETDKAVMEMEAFESGVLLKILHTEGAKLKVGQALAVIGKPGEDISSLLAGIPKNEPNQTKVETAHSKETQTSQPSVSVSTPPLPSSNKSETKQTSINSVTAVAAVTSGTSVSSVAEFIEANRGGLRVLASPLAKSIAIEHGVDLHTVIGTGPEGRITKKDVLNTLSQGSRSTQFASKGTTRADEVVTLNGMRKTIAKRLTESKQNLPHFYLNVDVNAKAMESFRSELLEFQKHLEPELQVKVSLNDIIVKATAAALRLHPKVNASFLGDSILQFGRVDVGIAVSLDGGLLTPVIRGADGKSILEISKEVKELAKRARERKLKPEEFSNGTFTISNLGMYGISRFTAIINEPESGILAVGSVEDKPVVENGAVVAGRVLSLTLSCDHRVIDGAVGAEFLRTLKSLLEQPSLMAGVI